MTGRCGRKTINSRLVSADLLSIPENGSAIVLGASGGLGRAFSDQIQITKRFVEVLELSRTSRPAIELEDEASLASAAEHASALGDIRLVIDATGFLHDGNQGPEKSLRDIDPTMLGRAFAINAIGPALIMKHFLPLLPRSGKAVFATISARLGSISDNHLGGWYGYRASKAALNQLVHTAAIELKRLRPDAICVALHPGTVDTPLSRPFRGKGLTIQSPTAAAEKLIAVINQLKPHQSGAFVDWRGSSVPW